MTTQLTLATHYEQTKPLNKANERWMKWIRLCSSALTPKTQFILGFTTWQTVFYLHSRLIWTPVMLPYLQVNSKCGIISQLFDAFVRCDLENVVTTLTAVWVAVTTTVCSTVSRRRGGVLVLVDERQAAQGKIRRVVRRHGNFGVFLGLGWRDCVSDSINNQ